MNRPRNFIIVQQFVNLCRYKRSYQDGDSSSHLTDAVGRMEIRGTPWPLNCTKCDIIRFDVRLLWNLCVKNLLVILERNNRTAYAYVSNDTRAKLAYIHRDKSHPFRFLSLEICQHIGLFSWKCTLPACRLPIGSITKGWGFAVEINDVNRRLEYSGSLSHLLFVSESRCAGTSLVKRYFIEVIFNVILIISSRVIRFSLVSSLSKTYFLFKSSRFVYSSICYLGLETGLLVPYCNDSDVKELSNFKIHDRVWRTKVSQLVFLYYTSASRYYNLFLFIHLSRFYL